MKHCIFCLTEYDDDVVICPQCHDYKGMVEGPVMSESDVAAKTAMSFEDFVDQMQNDPEHKTEE